MWGFSLAREESSSAGEGAEEVPRTIGGSSKHSRRLRGVFRSPTASTSAAAAAVITVAAGGEMAESCEHRHD